VGKGAKAARQRLRGRAEKDSVMGDKTGISWTDSTWNPIRGCSRVSPGCVNCYAEKAAARFSGPGAPYEGLISISKREKVLRRDLADGGIHLRKVETTVARWNGTVRMILDHLDQPIRWRRPRRALLALGIRP
jgi:protein gp37